MSANDATPRRCGFPNAAATARPCQRVILHAGNHAPYRAEAVRLDRIEKWESERAVDEDNIGDRVTCDVIAAAIGCAPLLQHNRECDPLSAGQSECRCGLWALQSAVRAFEARYP